MILDPVPVFRIWELARSDGSAIMLWHRLVTSKHWWMLYIYTHKRWTLLNLMYIILCWTYQSWSGCGTLLCFPNRLRRS
jgi:hypothetical protein